MKKLFLIFALFALIFNVEAQKLNVSVTGDTVGGETSYFGDDSYKFTIYSGIVGFNFTTTDVADSLSSLNMQGSWDGTNFTDLTGTAAKAATTTDGTYFLYVLTPKYLEYRLKAVAASGDSTILTNISKTYKKTTTF